MYPDRCGDPRRPEGVVDSGAFPLIDHTVLVEHAQTHDMEPQVDVRCFATSSSHRDAIQVYGQTGSMYRSTGIACPGPSIARNAATRRASFVAEVAWFDSSPCADRYAVVPLSQSSRSTLLPSS